MEGEENKKIPCIVIAGPTASGKTELGVELAKLYDGEVVSADSMQVYKGMDILTAKPTKEEMQGIPHYMIGIADPSKPYSVAEYVGNAKKHMFDIYKRGKLPIIVGGTGLYIDSLLKDADFSNDMPDMNLREKLYSYAKENGSDELYKKLMEKDPQAAKEIHPNNTVRIVRALEVCITSGKTFSEIKQKNFAKESPYNPCMIALGSEDRQFLYDRCDRRCQKMIDVGLLDEVSEILKKGNLSNSFNAIGLKEWKPYFEKISDFESCFEQMKLNTRHYAKRQLTWFRRNSKYSWIMVDKFSQISTKIEICKKIVVKQNIL